MIMDGWMDDVDGVWMIKYHVSEKYQLLPHTTWQLS